MRVAGRADRGSGRVYDAGRGAGGPRVRARVRCGSRGERTASQGAWIWVQNFVGNITGAWRRVTDQMVIKFFQMEEMVPTKRFVVVVR